MRKCTIYSGCDMEKINKIGGDQNKYTTLNTVKKPSTIVTAAVIGASLLGVLRPSEKPAQAHVNPIVAGLVQGFTYGLENGVNYEIARHVGGFYNPYYGGAYGGYEGSYPTYPGGYPAYVSPYNGYNCAPAYVTPFNGYNYAPTYVSPFNGYNDAPAYVSPYGGTEGSYPVSPYNAAPVYVPPVQSYVPPVTYSTPSSTPAQIVVQPQVVYQSQTLQAPAPVVVEPLPKSKVVMSWPEKEAIIAAQNQKLQEEKLTLEYEIQNEKAILAAQNAQQHNVSKKSSKSFSVSVEKDTFKNKDEKITVQKETIKNGNESSLVMPQMKLLKRSTENPTSTVHTVQKKTTAKVESVLNGQEKTVAETITGIVVIAGVIGYFVINKLKGGKINTEQKSMTLF